MKYITLFMTILYIVSCIFVISYFNKCEEFYSEFNTEVEMLNDRIDRILYVKVLQEEDAELKWDSWKWERDKELSTTLRIEYGLEFTDTFSNDRYLTGNEGLYLMDDGVLGVSKDVPIYPNLYLMGDVFVYPDQFGGNTYVINAKGDTIFKYIKREKE